MPKPIQCETCDGTGEVHSHNPICWTCHGIGLAVNGTEGYRRPSGDNEHCEKCFAIWSETGEPQPDQPLPAEYYQERDRLRRARLIEKVADLKTRLSDAEKELEEWGKPKDD